MVQLWPARVFQLLHIRPIKYLLQFYLPKEVTELFPYLNIYVKIVGICSGA